MAYQYCSDGRAYVRLNGCGVLCGGGVVGTAARSSSGGTATAESCQACPASFITGHSVQCCPANTALRTAADTGTASASNCGCNGNCCGCSGSCNGSCGCCGCNGCQCPSTRSCVTCSGSGNCGSTTSTASTGCTCTRNAASTTSTGCTCARSCNCSTASAASDAQQNTTSCPEAAGVGMVYAVEQTLGDVYQSESALRTGTLFPELNKPMNGRCPGSCNRSTPAQQNSFAAWDLRLYMDTHPDDPEALALFNQLSQEAGCGSYATAFLNGTGAGWNWTNDPWPWECRANA